MPVPESPRPVAEEDEAEDAEAEDAEAEDAEEEDPDEARLNAPARNKATIPIKVPDDVPYTRQALFDLLKFMEYSTDREVYETAWQRLQEKFSDQTAILNYLKTYYVDDEEKIVAKWAAHQASEESETPSEARSTIVVATRSAT
jgi:hypothetical protein